MYMCPVCGYAGLTYPSAEDGSICPCCSTEFGYGDFFITHEALRKTWIANGCQWWSPNRLPPENWSALKQLHNLEKENIK